jgi:hypothetical protein
MIKILVNNPQGIQEIIEVGEGGGYFDASRVLWDERIDGVLPSITVGGMVRQGNQLVFNSQLFAEYETKLAVINTPVAPTKEELMAELAALTAKIEALA